MEQPTTIAGRIAEIEVILTALPLRTDYPHHAVMTELKYWAGTIARSRLLNDPKTRTQFLTAAKAFLKSLREIDEDLLDIISAQILAGIINDLTRKRGRPKLVETQNLTLLIGSAYRHLTGKQPSKKEGEPFFKALLGIFQVMGETASPQNWVDRPKNRSHRHQLKVLVARQRL
jgi:hypothetical protein